MSRSELVRLLPLALILGCSTEPPSQLPHGQWHSPEVLFTVGDGGSVLNLPCRDALVPPTIPITEAGDFTQAITIEEFGAVYRTYPGVLAGRLTQRSLRISLTVTSERGTETFELQPGHGPTPPRCG